MGLESRWELLEKIMEINEKAGQTAVEIAQITKEIEEFEGIHKKFEQLYGNKFGINRRSLNRRIDEIPKLQRMKELIRVENSQPQKTNFLGIGGMKKDEYYTFTDKLNLVDSSLKGLIKDWNDYLDHQMEPIKSDFENYENEYQDLWKEYRVAVSEDSSNVSGSSADIKLCIGQLRNKMPDSEYVKNIFKSVRWDTVTEEMITLLLQQNMGQPQPLFVLYENDNEREELYSFVRNLMKQIMYIVPLYQYEFSYLDGMNNGSGLREMLELQNVRDAYADNIVPQLNLNGFQMLHVGRDSDGIHAELTALERYMGVVTDLLQGKPSFTTYNQENKEKIPYKLVILEGIGMNQESNLIKKLVINGSKCGIFVIFLQDKNDLPPENSYESKKNERFVLAESMAQIEYLNGKAFFSTTIGVGEKKKYAISLASEDNDYSSYVAGFVKEMNNVKSRDNSFITCFPDTYKYGQYTSTIETPEGNLEGKITIPFALDRRGRITSIELGSANYAHGLISGATGSGKSTMLHMLINSVVMNYSPDDVEIWLADYKKVEMSVYINERPPHIKFVGIERNEEFTFSLIDLIMEEHNRRMKLFAKENIRNIDIYKKKHGMGSLPRILLIIDEFHLMSQQVHENVEYSRKLENLLAEGRGMGIVCLFADQSISKGLNGLTQKGKAQMRMRLSMANDKEEMAITLDTNKISDAEATLEKGEVRVKRVREQRNVDGTMERITCLDLEKVINISDESRSQVALKAKELYGEGRDVLIVDGNKASEYDEVLIREYEQNLIEERETCSFYLGKPSNFEKCFAIPLLKDYGENVVCVLNDDGISRRVLLSALKSFMRDRAGEIYILADGNNSLFYKLRNELRKMNTENENFHIISEYTEICRTIIKLHSEIRSRTTQHKKNIMVVWFGLERMLKEFAHYPSLKKDMYENVKSKCEMDEIQDRLEGKFAGLFGGGFNKKQKVEEETWLYNLTEQVKELFEDGSARGIYQFLFYSSVLSVKNAKAIKMENFKYKISGLLSKDDSYDFFGNAKFMNSFYENEDGKDETLVCYDGIKARFFLPYLMEKE